MNISHKERARMIESEVGRERERMIERGRERQREIKMQRERDREREIQSVEFISDVNDAVRRAEVENEIPPTPLPD